MYDRNVFKKRILKFAICGGIGGLVQIAVFHLLFTLNVTVSLAYTLAFVVSTTVSYVLNMIWTFKDNESNSKSYYKYMYSMAITFLIGQGLIYLSINVLNINHIIANALVILIIFPINYLISKRIVWSKNKIENRKIKEPNLIRD